MALTAPVQVSPLIKFARWSFLLAGIAYGTTRWASLHKYEEARRAEDERLRPEREAKAKIEKEKRDRESLEELEKSLGKI